MGLSTVELYNAQTNRLNENGVIRIALNKILQIIPLNISSIFNVISKKMII